MNPWPWYTHASLMSPFQCCRCTCGNPNHSWVHDGQAAWHAAPDAAAPAAPVPAPVPAPPPSGGPATSMPSPMMPAGPAGGPSPSMPSGPFTAMPDPGGAAGFANANAPLMPGVDPNVIFYGGAAAPSGPQVSGMVGRLISLKNARVGPSPQPAPVGPVPMLTLYENRERGLGGERALQSLKRARVGPSPTPQAIPLIIPGVYGHHVGPLQSLKHARVGPSPQSVPVPGLSLNENAQYARDPRRQFYDPWWPGVQQWIRG